MLSLMLAALGATPGQAVDLAITLEDGLATARRGEVSLLEYHFAPDLPKPYVQPLTTPSGRPVTMASPPDHVHHRGLMFALGNVAFVGEEAQYVVFWGEAGTPDRLGHILHVPGSERVESSDEEAVTLQTRNEWRRLSDQALMLTEQRRITVHEAADPRCNLLTWDTELIAPTRDVVLGPTEGREVSYYGLGLRTTPDMNGGEVFDANGKAGEEAVLGDDATWCAYIGPGEPKRGFVMFDHPDNPRHPTGWFVMSAGFGYMTASVVCHRSLALPAGETLRLRYGVCAFDGAATAEEIGKWYEEWVEAEDE
jgi:hypothetical protein